MNGLLIAGVCLAGSALIVRALDLWIGSGRAKHHDLTSTGHMVGRDWIPHTNQLTRERRNDLSLEAYARRRDALGHGAVRPAQVRLDPAQLQSWEDDGGATA